MKKNICCLLALLTVFFMACSSELDNLEKNDPISSYDSTRKVFESEVDFEIFLKNYKSKDQVGDFHDELSILEKFLSYSAFGEIVNSNNEYQVGDFIYRFSNDGYSIYKVHTSAYADLISLLKNEEAIIENLGSYKEVADNSYELSNNLFLLYSGVPFIESVNITPPDTRISDDGKTKISIEFYSTYAVVHSECGVKVHAYSRNEKTGKWEDYKTTVQIDWALKIGLSNGGYMSNGGNQTRHNTNSYTHKIADSFGAMVNRYSLMLGSRMHGSCVCWDGKWLHVYYEK